MAQYHSETSTASTSIGNRDPIIRHSCGHQSDGWPHDHWIGIAGIFNPDTLVQRMLSVY